MEEESSEIHSEDDKALSDKNKKRVVKTRAQIQALEKFYNEHKYPSESMKIELGESICLTEKQVSSWFCHRRSKDKRLTNGETNTTLKQDHSGVIVQDRGSGHRQDSCGSTKQNDNNKLFDTREVESARLTAQYNSQDAGNYGQATEGSSGGSSSSRDSGNHVPATALRYPVPRFPVEEGVVKPRTGPSGYLKVKGRVENVAITSVKIRLGKNYRVDGPPLSVVFDPLPSDAFELSLQDPEHYYTEEAELPNSHIASMKHQIPKVGEGYKYNSSIPPYNSDNASVRTNDRCDAPNKQSRSSFNSRKREGIELARVRSSSPSHPLHIIGEKSRKDKTEFSYLTGKANENLSTRIMKDEEPNIDERRAINERRVKMRNDYITGSYQMTKKTKKALQETSPRVD